jgi:hypothetical protein
MAPICFEGVLQHWAPRDLLNSVHTDQTNLKRTLLGGATVSSSARAQNIPLAVAPGCQIRVRIKLLGKNNA